VKEQAEALKAAQQALAALKEEIARLKSGGSGDKTARELPAFVKAQGKPAPPKPRKKRAQRFTPHRLPPLRRSFLPARPARIVTARCAAGGNARAVR